MMSISHEHIWRFSYKYSKSRCVATRKRMKTDDSVVSYAYAYEGSSAGSLVGILAQSHIIFRLRFSEFCLSWCSGSIW